MCPFYQYVKFTLCNNNNNNKGTELHNNVNWNIWYPKYISERASCTFIAKCLSQGTCICVARQD